MSSQKDTVTIILVHSGPSNLPLYIKDTINISVRVAPTCQLVLIANQLQQAEFNRLLAYTDSELKNRASFVAIEDIPESPTTIAFRTKSTLDKSFRNGFWFHTSARFFIIADYLCQSGKQNCIHIENDVVLYFDPAEKIEAFQGFAKFAVPLDRVRAIPGIVWLSDKQAAEALTRYMLVHSDKDDMVTVGQFVVEHPDIARALPTIPTSYVLAHNLDPTRYSAGIDKFGGLFDAAAIGQFIGGGHRLYNPEATRFFLNECSDLNMAELTFSWATNDRLRHPTIRFGENDVTILSIHAHCKDLDGISPFNSGKPDTAEDIVTGERIQAFASLTISSREVTAFHGRDKIKSKEFIEIPEYVKRRFFKPNVYTTIPPSADFVNLCSSFRTIFVYTHLLGYFKKYIAPHLNEDFVLISHNSDDAITHHDLELLNHFHLKKWFAQNIEFNHQKLCALPIGLANSQWGATRPNHLYEISKSIKKSKLVYANFQIATHPSRTKALEVVQRLGFVSIEKDVPFEQYIQNLAAHKFCICPRGNGIDTHRFWEAQYLDTIPIILLRDWTPAYSGFPVLLVAEWVELTDLNLDRIYIELTTSRYQRPGLSLKNIYLEINHQVDLIGK
jgi:hypothetical protein